MSRQNEELERRLRRMSRDGAPDGWSRLRDNVRRSGVAQERSTPPMKRKTSLLLAFGSAAAALAIATLVLFLSMPKPVEFAFEAGKTVSLSNGTLVIHEVSRGGGRIAMPPDADTVELAHEDLAGLFGRDPIPALPGGLKADAPLVSAMLFRSGTVFLMDGIAYSADAGDPSAPRVFFDLNDQGELPLTDCVYGNGEMSTVDGIEMLVGLEVVEEGAGPVEYYTAQFVAHNIGYRIRAVNMKGAEFLAILEAVVAG